MFPADQLSCDTEKISEWKVELHLHVLSVLGLFTKVPEIRKKLIVDLVVLTIAKLQLDWISILLFCTLHTNKKTPTNFYTLMPSVVHLLKPSMSIYVILLFFFLWRKKPHVQLLEISSFFLVGSNSLSWFWFHIMQVNRYKIRMKIHWKRAHSHPSFTDLSHFLSIDVYRYGIIHQ